MSDLVEVPITRQLLRDRLLAGIGHPAIAIRIGVPARGGDAAGSPTAPSIRSRNRVTTRWADASSIAARSNVIVRNSDSRGPPVADPSSRRRATASTVTG